MCPINLLLPAAAALLTAAAAFSASLLPVAGPSRQMLLEESWDCPAAYASAAVPRSVHRLRPGDIRVVAAMGDSLTAGNGALSSHIVDVVTNYRGVSWSGGGVGHFSRVLTLPNVLKQFSHQLTGYATGSGDQNSVEAGLNVAVAGSVHQHMPDQARALVAKMRQCQRVSVEHDWKLVTVMIGGNNLCHSVCQADRSDMFAQSAYGHALYIAKALDILHSELPRTFVNLVPVVDVTALRDVHRKNLPCKLAEQHLCPCLFGRRRWKTRHMRRWVAHYQAALVRLVRSGRYDTRADFTVVLQPFNLNSRLPLRLDTTSSASTASSGISGTSSGGDSRHHSPAAAFWPPEADHSFLSADCFHLSQRGHALMARALWNNMVQPLDAKSLSWRSMDEQLLCPSWERPFFTTAKNPTGSFWYSDSDSGKRHCPHSNGGVF